MAQDSDKIAKLLSDIQKTNNSNADNFDRILSNISSKLEKSISNTNAELFKGYINELTKSLDDKYEQTYDKFEDIEKALKAVYETQDSHVKNTDMKELFDVLSKNINNFYTEARQEKAILAGIETKLADFSSNKTDKEDILRTISLMRNDIGNINISYKNTIDDINSTLKSILSGIKSFDPLKTGETAKAQIDIMFKAINDIIANLHEIDNRESNLEKVLSNVVTTEDLKVTNGIIDSIIEKTNEIEEKLSNNTQKEDLSEVQKTLAFIYDKTDLQVTKEELLKVDEKTNDLLSQTNDIKQALSKMAMDIENIPDAGELEVNLKKLYTHIYDIADNIDKMNVNFASSGIDDKLNNFKEELSLIQNIVSDCNEAITSRIIKAIESVSFSDEEIKKSLKEIVEQYPSKEDIKQILEESIEINTILDRTDRIYQKVEQINDGFLNMRDYAANILNSSNNLKNDINSISEFIKKSTGFDNDYIKSQLEEMKSIIETNIINSGDDDTKTSSEINSVKEYLNELKNLFQENPKGTMYSKIMAIEDSLVNNQTFNESAFTQILSKINNFKSSDNDSKDDEQIAQAITEISSLKSQISNLEKLFEKKDRIIINNSEDNSVSKLEEFLSEKFNEISKDFEKLTDITSGKLSEGFAYQTELLEKKTSVIKDMLSDKDLIEGLDNPEFANKLSVANESLNDFSQELQLVATDITENISNRASKVLDELNSIKELLDKISDNMNPKSLKNKITSLNDELKSDSKLTDYTADIDNLYKELSLKFDDNENNLKDFILNETDSLILKFEDLKEYVENSLESVTPPDENTLAELKTFISGIEQFKQSQEIFISDKIEEVKNEIKTQNDEIKSLLTVCANHDDIIKAIEALKTTFRNYKSKSKSKTSKDEEASEDTFYNLDAIEDLRSDFEKYSKKIEALSDDNTKITEFLQSISERLNKDTIKADKIKVGSEIEDDELSDYFDDENEDIFGENKFDFVQAFDILQNDIRYLKDSVEEVKKDSEEKDSKIPSVNNSGIIMNMSSKLDNLLKDLNNNWLNNLQEYIKTGTNDINAKLASIDSKLDVFVSDTTNTDMLNDLNDMVSDIEPKLSSMLEELNSKISDISSKNIEINEINKIKSLIEEQKNYIEALEPNEKLSAFKKCLDEITFDVNALATDSNADSEKLQSIIKEMKESLMSAVVTIFDQVSFIEETEDIKDFVEERTDEINQRISEITKQLQQITSSEDSNNYTYTMQDIETDLAKLRLALQDSKQSDLSDITEKLRLITSSVDSLSQEEIKELKTEITNLKEQTQFLIATSDKSYNALNTGIEGFEQVINESITDRVDKLHKMLESSAQSDKVIKQALIYMGEWIDSASESINKISANSDEITRINEVIDALNDIKGSIDTKINEKFTDWNAQLKVIEKRFDKIENLEEQLAQQQERIDRLELNISKLISVVENLDDPAISRKIDKIDKQTSKLGTNIEKLASYVD